MSICIYGHFEGFFVYIACIIYTIQTERTKFIHIVYIHMDRYFQNFIYSVYIHFLRFIHSVQRIYTFFQFHIHFIYTYIQTFFKFHIQCIYTVYIGVYIIIYIYKFLYIGMIYTKNCIYHIYI